MTLNPATDLFLVNSNNETKTVTGANLLNNINDSDHMLVNRTDVTYKVDGKEIRDFLANDAIFPDPGDISGPNSGSGTEADPFILDQVVVYDPGSSAQTLEEITISNVPPDSVGFFTNNSDPAKRFDQPGFVTDSTGTWQGRLIYKDDPVSQSETLYIGKFQIGTAYFQWNVMQLLDQPQTNPEIDAVVLTENNTSDPRFTDQTFDVALTMKDQGFPVSTKTLQVKTSGNITEEESFNRAPTSVKEFTAVGSGNISYSLSNRYELNNVGVMGDNIPDEVVNGPSETYKYSAGGAVTATSSSGPSSSTYYLSYPGGIPIQNVTPTTAGLPALIWLIGTFWFSNNTTTIGVTIQGDGGFFDCGTTTTNMDDPNIPQLFMLPNLIPTTMTNLTNMTVTFNHSADCQATFWGWNTNAQLQGQKFWRCTTQADGMAGSELQFSTNDQFDRLAVGDAVTQNGASIGTVTAIDPVNFTITVSGSTSSIAEIQGPIKDIVKEGVTKYLQFNNNGDVSDLLDAPMDPAWSTQDENVNLTLTFPSQFLSGQAPDAELLPGTIIEVEASAETPGEPISTATSNIVQPGGAAYRSLTEEEFSQQRNLFNSYTNRKMIYCGSQAQAAREQLVARLKSQGYSQCDIDAIYEGYYDN